MSPDTVSVPTATGRSVPKPALYLVILLCTILGALTYKLRTDTIFSCPADGYEPDQYLAYCHAADYGDYDRGAFWFDLEPQARRRAVSADVLFLGSSRMQFAFSTPATDSWFAAAAASHYLLGFTATENALFAGPLLANLKPAAKVYVINLDRFFGDQETSVAKEILRGEATQARFQEKRLWQAFHKRICTALPALCGDHFAYFRYRKTGAWQNKGWDKVWKSRPKSVAEGAVRDWGRWQQYPALGEQFLSQLPVHRSCVVLTLVPSAMAATTRSEAATLAAALGIELMVPQLEGLQTFDGSHLDRASAERWAAAFFRTAGPRIRACLEGSETASPAGSAQVSRMAE